MHFLEEEYQTLCPIVGNALSSMAISKIKKDEYGNPDRAKYRIVVLVPRHFSTAHLAQAQLGKLSPNPIPTKKTLTKHTQREESQHKNEHEKY